MTVTGTIEAALAEATKAHQKVWFQLQECQSFAMPGEEKYDTFDRWFRAKFEGGARKMKPRWSMKGSSPCKNLP